MRAVKMIGVIALGVVSVLALSPRAEGQGTLFVEGDNVGIGVSSPTEALHVFGGDGQTRLMVHEASGTTNGRILMHLRNNGGVNFFMEDTAGDDWQFIGQSGGSFPGFSISRAGSGVREFRVGPTGTVYVNGSVVHSSSRAVKEEITEVDRRDILARLSELPVSGWSYTGERADGARHIGPMAEDFHAAFGLGTDDAHIALNDSVGVALAAIQGLHDLVKQKDGEIDELKRRLDALEELLKERQ
jgi:hypothetical protein